MGGGLVKFQRGLACTRVSTGGGIVADQSLQTCFVPPGQYKEGGATKARRLVTPDRLRVIGKRSERRRDKQNSRSLVAGPVVSYERNPQKDLLDTDRGRIDRRDLLDRPGLRLAASIRKDKSVQKHLS